MAETTKEEINMSVKEEINKLSECAELVFESSSVAFATAGLVNPIAGIIGPLINIAALPFAAHNYSFIKRKINEIISEVNRHEIRLDKIEKMTEEQKETLTLNGYKFFDYCLKEKMKSKIQAYAKIFADSIGNGSAMEENDIFDIQMDIINSLRTEDIELLNYIITYLKNNRKPLFVGTFDKYYLKTIVASSSKGKDTLNEYALRHLINLGLISEEINAKLPNVVGEETSFSDELLFKYSLTQRCRMIYDAIIADV